MNYDLASAYIIALTGSKDTVMDWRVIHDREKGEMGKNIQGSLDQVWQQLVNYNQQFWGVFVCINALDGQGHSLNNVHHIRTHVADLDDTLTSAAAYQRATSSNFPPHFAVQTSPNKFHLYWLTEPYVGNEFYTLQQRKLAQIYDADKSIIDATRVMRVAGFYHCKGEPQMVTCWGVSNSPKYKAEQIESYLSNVNIIEHFGTRAPLGNKDLQAPSFEWLVKALYMLNPNELARQDWLSISAAFKQAGWNLATEKQLLDVWNHWCSYYSQNDASENLKLWNSIKDTEVGWAAFLRRTAIQAYMQFGDKVETPVMPVKPVTAKTEKKRFAEIIGPEDFPEYFKGCYFIERMGKIFTASGRFMNSTEFNGAYGGHQFILTSSGSKLTDEPWKAALRSTVWTIPKVDHVRFLPSAEQFEIVDDELGRRGLNTYLPARVKSKEGDVSLWLKHVENILPVKEDRDILFSYMAHCVKYQGYKIPWAIMLQSCEGVGKTVFYEVLQNALGSMYIYSPKAEELVSSGSKFNAWMRSRLMIVVNEIKVDERRELIEILKPMITDSRVEVQAKGVDQEMEDNCANWLFFSNFKDAIPIGQNGRRFSVFFSKLQYARDLLNAGMDDVYFTRLWGWLRNEGGYEAITHWLLNYPIEKGALPSRAPKTSSYDEALRIGRSPIEVVLDDKIQMKEQGFRNGFVSVTMFIKAVTAHKIKLPTEHTIKTILENRGYHQIGYTSQPVMNEDLIRPSMIYSLDCMAHPDDYKQ